jgi:hypothetical protein
MNSYNPKTFDDVKKEHLKLDVGDFIIAQKEIIVSDKFTIKKYDRIKIIEMHLDTIYISVGDKLWDSATVPFISDDLDISHYSYLFHENFFTEREYIVEQRRKKISSLL